ncbi:MAG TPA: aminotransferase class V-fold PLP-dependent enzyme [Acidimicrobiales bacterium]|nr:aminotransferase class V-fold PLP-dependent enzyme [Acidimicrobiales bacterium]
MGGVLLAGHRRRAGGRCGPPADLRAIADPTDRATAEALDAADPLAPLVAESVVADPDLVYLDGNSLGRLTHRARRRLAAVVDGEWAAGLVRSWDTWADLPARVGDAIAAHLIGARPGEVVVGDSTTVNLYKAAAAAVAARPGARAVVTDDDNFPTDRYLLEGLAARHGLAYREVASDPVDGPDPGALAPALEGAALLCLSHVAYRSAALADMAALTRLAHDHGALVLWDLSHAAGSVPVDLTGSGADLAVGCTYKYLAGGPGAPAFTYVRRELQDHLRQPIWGWFGRRDQFAMEAGYDPVAGIGAWLTGTPSILALACVEEGLGLLADAGIARLRAKGMALTSLVVDLADAWLAPRGYTVASPRDPARRGSHVALAHPDAARVVGALAAAGVITDFRAPDRVRLGPAPVASRFVDVWDALDRMRRLTG